MNPHQDLARSVVVEEAPAWVEVDEKAIEQNLEVIQACLSSTTELCVALKADAFGHGADVVLPILMRHGIRHIGITSNSEARIARRLGYSGRILRLHPGLEEEVAGGLTLDVEEWIGGPDHAQMVARVARRYGVRVGVHLSLNSGGLSRDGIEMDSSDGSRFVTHIAKEQAFRIVGICTHFAEDDADAAAEAYQRFDRHSQSALGIVSRANGSIRMVRHCAASFAALTEPRAHFDMVRVGAAVFGEHHALDPRFRTALALRSRVAAVNSYPRGATVGYDCTHTLADDSKLAVVPIGYSGGIPRRFGGRAGVLIRGQRARIVGHIAMNSLMVDVSNLPRIEVGDTVTFYGGADGASITHNDLAEWNGDAAAELFTIWGKLHPRMVVCGPPT